DEAKVPRLCFVNKLDRMGASFDHSFKTILDRLSKKAVRIQLPIGVDSEHEGVIDLLKMKGYLFEGDKGKDLKEIEIPEKYLEDAKSARAELVERIAEHDEQLTTDFLEGKEISIEDLKRVLRKATIANEIFPVLCGSALKNKGVQLMLDAVVDYLPSPLDMPGIKGTNPTTGDEETRQTSDDEAFSALAFKLQADPFVGQLTFFRVYSGMLKSGSYVYNPINEERERVGRIVRLHANHREEVEEVYAGEIAAIVGLKNTKTGHTLCDENKPIILEGIISPEPVIEMRIEPKTKADQEKMGLAMKKLSDEDPTFRIKTDPETMETIIAGMGELHLEVLVERMKREFNVEANTGKPQVAYKETITGEAEAEGKYIKQSGGRGQYGHVRLRIKPLPKEVETDKKIAKNIKREANFEFINNIKGGVVPAEYIPAIEKGVREGLSRGVLAGFEMVDVSVELYDGSYHEVDSSEMAFKMAGSMAIQDATRRAKPVLLEPIMKVEVTTPEKFMGDVTGHLSSKRGQIESMVDRNEIKVITAKVPLSEMFGYMTTLRSMTEGRANFTMEFLEYAIIPTSVAQTIIESRK
ncbi:MAG: elongation factor G, partial [Candidatus Paceibacterota bacterium]